MTTTEILNEGEPDEQLRNLRNERVAYMAMDGEETGWVCTDERDGLADGGYDLAYVLAEIATDEAGAAWARRWHQTAIDATKQWLDENPEDAGMQTVLRELELEAKA